MTDPEPHGRIASPDDGSRTPPHDLEIERQLIGAVIEYEHVYDSVSEIIRPEDFYSEAHRIIFRAAATVNVLYGKVERPSLKNQLRKDNQFDKIGGIPYFQRIVDSIPTSTNAPIWAGMIREKAIFRDMIDAGSRMSELAFNEQQPAPALLERCTKMLYDIEDRSGAQDAKMMPMPELVELAVERMQQRHEMEGKLTGVPSGYIDLDRLTGGWQKGHLVILAARAGMGKTALAVSCLEHGAKEGHDCAIFELEMDKRDLIDRMFAKDLRIDLDLVVHSVLEDYEWAKVPEQMHKLKALPIHATDEASITVSGMRSRIKRLQRKLKMQGRELDLVIVDYVQLMEGEGKIENNAMKVADISRALKVLAKDLDVAVIALAQVKREVETRFDKRPLMSDLSNSGALEQDSDMVLFVYREEYYSKEDTEEEDKGIAEIICRKHRNGPTGTVKLKWQAEYASFENLARVGVVPPGPS